MIFISHSSKDKAAALDVMRKMIERGYDKSQLFLDSEAESGIKPGSKWEQELYWRLKECRALIVLCSSNWQMSRWCFAELVYSKITGKPVFPVLLEPCQNEPILMEHQAVSPFDEGEAAFARLWQVLENRFLGPREVFGWPPENGDGCPFPGLRPFDESLAGVYFGREVEIQALSENLRRMRSNGEPRLLMIIGASGSGKSSLLRAGLIPRLRHKSQEAEWLVLPPLRFGEWENSQWTIFDQLVTKLLQAFQFDQEDNLRRTQIRDRLLCDNVKEAAAFFLDQLQELVIRRGCPDATVVIAIDQFEELLDASAGDSASRFLKFLQSVVSRRNDRVLVIGTMRSDYLDRFEKSQFAVSSPYFAPWRLEPFSPERIKDVIKKPADRAGIKITDALVDKLKIDTPSTEALPLLAFTLEKMYRNHLTNGELGLDQYDAVGRIEKAIQTCIEQVLPRRRLEEKPELKHAVRMSFTRHLAQVDEKGEVIKQRCRWDDLPEAAKPILDRFVEERLLIKTLQTSQNESGESWISLEVSHEAIFRCWPELASWLRTSIGILRWRRDLQRDQASDKKWKGLSRTQLAVARSWLYARRDELTDDEAKWIRNAIYRERFQIGLVSVVILLTTSLSVITYRALETTRQQRNSADSAKRVAEKNSAQTALQTGHSALKYEADVVAGLLWYANALGNAPGDDIAMRESVRTLIAGWSPLLPLRSFLHDNAINAISISRDGRRLATASDDRTVRLWNIESGEGIGKPIDQGSRVEDVSFSPRGDLLAAQVAGWIIFLDPMSGYRIRQDTRLRSWWGSAFNHDGSLIVAITDRESWVKFLDPYSRIEKTFATQIAQAMHHYGASNVGVAFRRDGQEVITMGTNSECRRWNVTTGEEHPVRLIQTGPRAASYSIDGKTIVVGGQDYSSTHGELIIWDAETGKPKYPLKELDAPVVAVDHSLDGRRFATASAGRSGVRGEAKLWDAYTGEPLEKSFRHGDFEPVTDVAFTPDSEAIVTASADGTARLWSLALKSALRDGWIHEGLSSSEGLLETTDAFVFLDGTGRICRWKKDGSSSIDTTRLALNQNELESAVFRPDGNVLATIDSNYGLRFWDTTSGQQIGSPLTHPLPVPSMTFCADGTRLLTLAKDGILRLWNAQDPVLVDSFPQGKTYPSVRVSPDGKMLMTANADRMVQIRDATTAKVLKEFQHPDRYLAQIGFSPDNRTVLTNSPSDSKLSLWDIDSGQRRGDSFKGRGNSGGGRHLFSNDNKTLTIERSYHVLFFDVETGQQLPGEIEHRDVIRTMAFSPDNKTFASGSSDKTAVLWDVERGAPIGTPLNHNDYVMTVLFSPNGETVATAVYGVEARIWDARTAEPITKKLVHPTEITSMAFSSNGRMLVVGTRREKNEDGGLYIWDVTTGELVQEPYEIDDTVRVLAVDQGILSDFDGSRLEFWDLPVMVPDRPERVRLSIEVRTGYGIADGMVKKLAYDDWMSKKTRLKSLGGDCFELSTTD